MLSGSIKKLFYLTLSIFTFPLFFKYFLSIFIFSQYVFQLLLAKIYLFSLYFPIELARSKSVGLPHIPYIVIH